METVINQEADLKVVGSVFSGEKALEFLHTNTPDIITLDVEMPGLGGLATLAQIQTINKTLPADKKISILMVSAYTSSTTEAARAAMEAGADDFMTKPSTQINESTPVQFSHELIHKLRKCLVRKGRRSDALSTTILRETSKSPVNPSKPACDHDRHFSAILIGSSTGGPKALADLLPELTNKTDAPVLIVQHLPAGFTHSLAENLQRLTQWPVQEAQDQQEIKPRNIYIAPSGHHLTMMAHGSGKFTMMLTDDPPESGCRPSASVLFRSAAQALGSRALAIILTGMGNDGAAGLCEVSDKGGYVIAQDEASSVVWGMPGSAVEKNAVHRILPLDLIASHVALVTGRNQGT